MSFLQIISLIAIISQNLQREVQHPNIFPMDLQLTLCILELTTGRFHFNSKAAALFHKTFLGHQKRMVSNCN